MKEAKKREKSFPTEGSEEDKLYEKSLDDFAKLLAEEEERKEVLEPFEAYSKRIKTRIHSNLEQFRTRFAKGYHVLLEELSKEKPDQGPGPTDIRP